MKEKIKVLIQLQNCDNGIKEINDRKKEGPLKIVKLEEDLNAIESKFQEEYQRLETLKKERRKLEQEIQDFDNKIENSNIKLSNIKSNKEYGAVLKEIEDLNKGKSQIEDQVILMMEEIDGLEKKCLENKQKESKLRKKFELDKKDILKELDGLGMKLEDLEKRRSVFCRKSDQDFLKRYHFLRDRKGGLAISSVIRGVCQTCHIEIPPQKFNELMKCKTFLSCPNCNRILYWGDDEHFQNLTNA